MTVSDILIKMLCAPEANPHDKAHLLKVWGYARTIGEAEHLPADTQFILEAAAIVHDIACPFCREKYGSAPGNLQEKESAPLVDAFFKDTDLTPAQLSRISFLVCHHHTVKGVDGPDWQILLEADYLVNADEGRATPENIRNTFETMYKTETGKKLLKGIYNA